MEPTPTMKLLIEARVAIAKAIHGGEATPAEAEQLWAAWHTCLDVDKAIEERAAAGAQQTVA